MPPAKRRKVAPKVEEVNFDSDARHEFLTGFRKRKQQRVRHAQEVAEKRAREDARIEKKRMREQRTAEFQQAVDEHRKQLERIADGNESDDKESGSAKEPDGGDEEWEGFEEPPVVDYEAEYIDEDKYTTVTVEEMDATREGLLKSRKQENSDEDEETQPDAQEVEQKPDAPPTRAKSTKPSTKPKKKKARFRYESKEDRKINDLKLRMSKKKKAAARREQ